MIAVKIYNMKIYINEKKIKTVKTYLRKWDFLKLNGDKSLVPAHKDYNVTLEVSKKYWEDKYVFDSDDGMFEIKDGMRFKVFPKASTSNYGTFV